MLSNADALFFLHEQGEFSNDIVFCDPPYALGSKVIIRADGKPDYSKAVDFMAKWKMPDGGFWEGWFKEAFRTLKHGGYCVMYGMDRQLLLFKYYAALAGFAERQSLYWYFISNFPKASDLSKNLDKNAGAERSRIDFIQSPTWREKEGRTDKQSTVPSNEPITPLAKKYDGYKYSISPLKQTNETIMVFQKPYKTGSCLHDTLAYEAGDETVCCGALAIERNRVPSNLPENRRRDGGGSSELFAERENDATYPSGRYPAQTFVSPEAGEVLDRQSGIRTSGAVNGVYGHNEGFVDGKIEQHYEASSGGCSKILHHCDYEAGEMDLYMYCPKVSKAERNAGIEGVPRAQHRYGAGLGEGKHPEEPAYDKNFHPTVKPISLNNRILRLFKTPNPQRICIPFAGSGSEVIGAIKAGFTDWVACEINDEYIEIANARIKHWSDKYNSAPPF